MFLGRLKVLAVFRAGDFDQPLGRATDRANLFPPCGTEALGGSFLTQRALHGLKHYQFRGVTEVRAPANGSKKRVRAQAGV
jgi:hypothetical protein